jgi:hypothetical protein
VINYVVAPFISMKIKLNLFRSSKKMKSNKKIILKKSRHIYALKVIYANLFAQLQESVRMHIKMKIDIGKKTELIQSMNIKYK